MIETFVIIVHSIPKLTHHVTFSEKIQSIMSRIENLKAYDPFQDTTGEDDAGPGDQGLVHIRIQQRNGRKTLTTVQGLSAEYDFKKIVKVAKKEFACNGTVVEHSEYGEVIQLQVIRSYIVHRFYRFHSKYLKTI